MRYLLIAAMVVSFAAPFASATPGRTDANGCHTDRKGGTGYHCHGGGTGGATQSQKPQSQPTTRQTTSSSVYYQNCAAARAAGAAPIRRG